ncbi:L-histidine N(alpha)-methyltransferase [Hyphomicrobium sp.]|uniref:L-histidine N(alpha)-methyltransferase n=1 Tax=Hyphomicrobium sp. TaxID=82 RepID=UPI002E35C7B4|nr:L-histidine N(alpha)-methyltransferase [Hyphomicrobium sp.]HEX2842322.1 L-histidine N(alpha)-methyltransferase [Hyphomicrobium sp.]
MHAIGPHSAQRPSGGTAQIERFTQAGDGDQFAAAVLEGLSQRIKSLPSRFFYDAIGSELFEQITRLPEYYLTRTEAQILASHASEMIDRLTGRGVLVEFGSGSSLKTELLLSKAPRGIAYVPVDVSTAALADAGRRLASRFPGLDVRPVLADFSDPIALPSDLEGRPKVGFFPGSTIGNLQPGRAVDLLSLFLRGLSAGSRLIIGIDLKKDPRTLVRAYNDAAGVTAAFNLNILARVNRELGAAIDLDTFQHEAIYNPREGRIEMHLVSRVSQDVPILGRRFHFRTGESIHTENSYKYSIAQFHDVARASGWIPSKVWTDPELQFSVHELVAVDGVPSAQGFEWS